MDDKKSFVLYIDYRQHLDLLSDEERGQFLTALFDYVELGVTPELTGASLMAFSFIRAQIDRDNDKWLKKKEKARVSAQARWAKEEATACEQVRLDAKACERIPSNANDAVNVTVTANATVTAKEKELLPGAQGAPDRRIVAELLLNDKTLYAVTEDQADKWAGLYPAVDIVAELRKMVGWCDANPKKRKTRQGILRFINNWLSKEQDKGAVGNGSGHKNGDKNEHGQVFYNGKWVNV